MTKSKKEQRQGEISKNNQGCSMKIIDYINANNITVQFIDKKGAIIYNSFYRAFKKGNIKNPYFRSYLDVGYFGEGVYKAKTNGIKTKAYTFWGSMLTRCYSKTSRDSYKKYEDVKVCKEWHNFQNFAKWYEENYNPETMEGWQLDKDIICPECREYSPENCAFVPREINSFFVASKNRLLPKGVYKSKSLFLSLDYQSSNKSNKSKGFKTKKEALNFYLSSKRNKMREFLNKYPNLNNKIKKVLNSF